MCLSSYLQGVESVPTQMGSSINGNTSQWMFPISSLQFTPSKTTSSIPLDKELYDRARGVEFLFRLGVSLVLYVQFIFCVPSIDLTLFFWKGHLLLCILPPRGFIDSLCGILWRTITDRFAVLSVIVPLTYLSDRRMLPHLVFSLQLRPKNAGGNYETSPRYIVRKYPRLTRRKYPTIAGYYSSLGSCMSICELIVSFFRKLKKHRVQFY